MIDDRVLQAAFGGMPAEDYKPVPRCPDGSWSINGGSRRCRLPMGHSAPHVYEVSALDRLSRRVVGSRT